MIDAQLALVLVIVELSDRKPEITLNFVLVKFQVEGAQRHAGMQECRHADMQACRRAG